MAIGSLTVTPSAAAQAYARVAGDNAGPEAPGGGGFGKALSNALNSAVQTGEQADAQAAQGLNGQGDLRRSSPPSPRRRWRCKPPSRCGTAWCKPINPS
jgi:flagellar hook-basal body complex protein FliE